MPTSRSRVAFALPVELITSILNALFDFHAGRSSSRSRLKIQPTLLAASLISPAWNAAATDLLYRDIRLTSPRALTLLSRTLRKVTRLRGLVQSFLFIPNQSLSSFSTGDIGFSSWWEVQRIHALCPRLQWDSLKCWATDTKRHPRGFFHYTFDPLSHPLNTGKVNVLAITKLEIETIHCFPETYMPETLELPHLQDLTLKNFHIRNTVATWPSSTKMTYPQMLNLLRLRLQDCHFYGVLSEFRLPENCPQLCILEIIGGVYFQKVWDSIRRFAEETNLEVLTFTPRRSIRGPIRNDFSFLRRVTDLRLAAQCFNPVDAVEAMLPPLIQHLVIEDTTPMTLKDGKRAVQVMSDMQSSVEWILQHKTRFLPELESVKICGWVSEDSWIRHETLKRLGSSAGVKIHLSDSSPKRFDRITRMCHKLSPMF